jgi:hypothetical protein
MGVVDEPAGEVVRPPRARFSWPLRCSLYSLIGAVAGGVPGFLVGFPVGLAGAFAGAMAGFAVALASLRELHADAPPHACAVLVHHGGIRYEAGLAWVESGQLTFAGSSRNWSIPIAAIAEVRSGRFSGFSVEYPGGRPAFSSLVLTGASRLRAQVLSARRG